MFHSAHTNGRVITATIATMALTTAFMIGGTGIVDAQFARHDSVARAIDGLAGSPMALRTGPAARPPAPAAALAGQGTAAGKGRTPNKKALVGSWLETVTFPPEFGRPPLRSLSSYHDDGTMSCTDQGNVTTDPAMVLSACHGAWTHLHNRTFAYTAFELMSDLGGNLVGYLKFRGTYTLSPSGTEYDGTTLAEILDADGTVLGSVTVINAGERIQVELP